MTSSFAGKNIIVGVSGSIAAFKVAGWVSTLAQQGAHVSVIMTKSATKFVTPLTFSSLSGHVATSELFDDEENGTISHIQMATDADCIIVAPATAHTISSLAHGVADNLLTSLILATKAPVIVCPAMNPNMYSHPATKANIGTLQSYGYQIIEPEYGAVACKHEGIGRLADWSSVQEVLMRKLSKQDLFGHNVLITAGPTREVIDAARFLSNRSSGKMGYALAKSAYRRGANVTLITGPTCLSVPHGVECIPVQSADEMYNRVFENAKNATIIIKAAAVLDFKPVKQVQGKIKKSKAELKIELTPNPDILLELGRLTGSNKAFLVGFCAETDHLEGEGRRKLREKKVSLICANDIGKQESGFEADTNKITLIDIKDTIRLPMTSKMETANLIFDRIIQLI